MRIGISAASLGKRHSGIRAYTENLVRSLQGFGCELVVYSASDTFNELPGVVVRPTSRLLQAGAGPIENFARFGWEQVVLGHRLKRDHVQLLISPCVEGLLNPPIPQIITIHDLIPLLYREEGPRQYYFYKWVLPAIIRNTSLILTVSESAKSDIIRIYGVHPDMVAVAVGGIDLFATQSAVSPPGRMPERYFLYVGTFSPRKNLTTIIRAFAEVASTVSERLVVVAYPDRWQASTEALTRELGIVDKVGFTSDIPARELMELYKNATALILLSKYEGFGLPPLQAMALGVPAVVSDSSSLAEVTRGGAMQIPCEDIRAAAEAMKKLSLDSALRKTYSEMGRRKAAEYEASRCAERLRSTLRPLIERLDVAHRSGPAERQSRVASQEHNAEL